MILWGVGKSSVLEMIVYRAISENLTRRAVRGVRFQFQFNSSNPLFNGSALTPGVRMDARLNKILEPFGRDGNSIHGEGSGGYITSRGADRNQVASWLRLLEVWKFDQRAEPLAYPTSVVLALFHEQRRF